jgi:predicted nucleic acid-binding protein
LLADTTLIIDIMMNEPAAVQKAAEIERRGQTLSVGAPTIFELYVGLSLTSKPAEEKAKIAAVLASLPQLPLDHPSASAGGLIYGEKTRSGSKMDPEDAMIAGIAKANNKKIVTRNTRHFQGIEGATIEKY